MILLSITGIYIFFLSHIFSPPPGKNIVTEGGIFSSYSFPKANISICPPPRVWNVKYISRFYYVKSCLYMRGPHNLNFKLLYKKRKKQGHFIWATDLHFNVWFAVWERGFAVAVAVVAVAQGLQRTLARRPESRYRSRKKRKKIISWVNKN